MPLVLDATVGGPNANSYLTVAEGQTYFDSRLPLAGWDNADSQAVLLVMATRVLDALAQPFKTFFPASGGSPAYYRVRRQWLGVVASSTQRLAHPRIGLIDANGNAVPSTVIAPGIKEATAELAGQLGNGDRTLDNDVIIQGLTSVKAGSVSLSFKDSIMPQVIPQAVYDMLTPYLTDELYVMANTVLFDVVSAASEEWLA